MVKSLSRGCAVRFGSTEPLVTVIFVIFLDYANVVEHGYILMVLWNPINYHLGFRDGEWFRRSTQSPKPHISMNLNDIYDKGYMVGCCIICQGEERDTNFCTVELQHICKLLSRVWNMTRLLDFKVNNFDSFLLRLSHVHGKLELRDFSIYYIFWSQMFKFWCVNVYMTLLETKCSSSLKKRNNLTT